MTIFLSSCQIATMYFPHSDQLYNGKETFCVKLFTSFTFHFKYYRYIAYHDVQKVSIITLLSDSYTVLLKPVFILFNFSEEPSERTIMLLRHSSMRIYTFPLRHSFFSHNIIRFNIKSVLW